MLQLIKGAIFMTVSPITASKNAKISKKRAKKCLIFNTLDSVTKQQASNKKDISATYIALYITLKQN